MFLSSVLPAALFRPRGSIFIPIEVYLLCGQTVSRAWLGHNMKYIHNAIQTYNVTVALTTDRNVFYSVSKSFFTNSSGIEQTLSLPFNCFAHFSV